MITLLFNDALCLLQSVIQKHAFTFRIRNYTCQMPCFLSWYFIYFQHRYYVLAQHDDINIANIGGLRWQMVLCLMFSWLVVFLCIARGIKTSGKVSTVACLCSADALCIHVFKYTYMHYVLYERKLH